MNKIVAWSSVLVLAMTLCASTGYTQSRDRGTSLLKEGQRLQERARSQQDLDRVGKKFEEAVAAFEKSQDLKGQAQAFQKLGSFYQDKGDLAKAGDYYKKAGDAARRIGDRDLEADALRALGNLSRMMGSYPEALEAFRSVLQIAALAADDKGQARAHSEIGTVYKDSDDFARAEESFGKSLELAIKSSDPGLEADALNNLGTTNLLTGNYLTAVDLLKKALAAADKQGNVTTQESVAINLAYAYKALGRYALAAASADKALKLVQETKNPVTEATLLGFLGELYGDWGFHNRSEAFYAEALKLATRMRDKTGQARNLIRLAKAMEQRGKYRDALAGALQSLSLYKAMDVTNREAEETVAGLYIELGDLAKAQSFVSKIESPQLIGRLCLAQGDMEKALAQYKIMLDSLAENGVPDELFTAHTGMGKAYEGMQNFRDAEENYTKAVGVTEKLRASLLPSARRNFFAVKINGFDRLEPAKGLTRIMMKQGRWSDSIVPSELAKSRAFADRLALGSERGYSGVPMEVQEEEQSLNETLAALNQLRDCCSKKEHPKRYNALSDEIEKAQKKLDEFVDMLWNKYPPYAAVKYPRPFKLEDLTLSPDEYLVVFDDLGEGVAVKLLKGNEVIAAEFKKWNSREIAKAVSAFREPFESVKLEDFDPGLGQEIYTKLLASVLEKVPQGTRLTIMPDGVLAELPFEALVVGGKPKWNDGTWGPTISGVTYLGDIYRINYFQSLTALALSRSLEKAETRPVESMLVIADPVFDLEDSRAKGLPETPKTAKGGAASPDLMGGVESEIEGSLDLPRLSQTGDLAEDLSKLTGDKCSVYSGLKAGKEVFFNDVVPNIDRFRHVVFATHGIYSDTIPGVMEPVLALTMVPPGTDGLLKMTEVMSLKLGADLVALTACQTALGQQISGEGVASMGRAFQYAGARSVLMSLWSVDERASVMLMEGFFRNLLAGKTKYEAMRLARSKIRKEGYEHPFFWAAFILVGSGV